MSVLSANVGWMPIVLVLTAGFVGSAHCVGMCGPLVYSLTQRRGSAIAYHLSRLLSYSTAGAFSGTFGSQLFLEGSSPWLAGAALALFAALLAGVGLRQLSASSLHFQIPQRVRRTFSKFNQFLWARVFRYRDSSPRAAAAVAGATSVFLPCGHLFAFLSVAALTGSALHGAATMAAFAVGTLPALGFGVSLLQRLTSPRRRARIAGALFICAALVSLGEFAWAWRDHSHIAASRLNSTPTPQAPLWICH